MFRLYRELSLSLACMIFILTFVETTCDVRVNKASTDEDRKAMEKDASIMNEISKTLKETRLMEERYVNVQDLLTHLSNIQANQNKILQNQNDILEYRNNSRRYLEVLKDQTKRRDLTSTLYCDNQLDIDACLQKHFDTQLNHLRYIEGLLRSVKLVDDSGPHEGRVEIDYFGRHGTICDDGWDNIDAIVVCRMLGYAGGIAIRGPCCTGLNQFGQGTGEILLRHVQCNGDEDTLFSCPHTGIGVGNVCDHNEDAAVRCNLN